MEKAGRESPLARPAVPLAAPIEIIEAHPRGGPSHHERRRKEQASLRDCEAQSGSCCCSKQIGAELFNWDARQFCNLKNAFSGNLRICPLCHSAGRHIEVTGKRHAAPASLIKIFS